MAENLFQPWEKNFSDWGVELVEISIPPPGLEQQSQWLQIRKKD